MSNYDDFDFDDYSSGEECPMCCGSLVHDGICYECGADVAELRRATGLYATRSNELQDYLDSLHLPRSPHQLTLNGTTCYACAAPIPRDPRRCPTCETSTCANCGACACSLNA